jgi:hypothetical protein
MALPPNWLAQPHTEPAGAVAQTLIAQALLVDAACPRQAGIRAIGWCRARYGRVACGRRRGACDGSRAMLRQVGGAYATGVGGYAGTAGSAPAGYGLLLAPTVERRQCPKGAREKEAEGSQGAHGRVKMHA